MVQWLFGYLAGVIVICSLFVVLSRNPVHSILWMLLMFFHIAGLYLLLNAEFIAVTQIIVYAGAILVLFLFVVMLLNLEEHIGMEKQFLGGWPGGLSVALGILILLFIILSGLKTDFQGDWDVQAIEKATHTKVLGRVIYTGYLLPFEIVSLILLVAIIGAVVLAKRQLKP